MRLGKFRQKKCDQLHVFSLWRLTWVFDGTWKNFHKKSVPSHRFLRCADYLKFLMGIGIIFTKKCAQSHVSSLWRLTWVFDATWKVSTKKVWPVTRFFAVETNLSFWWDLEKFSQKKCAQSQVSSLWRLTWVFVATWKVSTKKVWPVTRFFAVETNLGFWWDLEKFSQKKCAQSQVSSLCRLSQVFDGHRNNFHKKVCPVTRFFAVETNLSFWCDLESFDKKSVTSYTFFCCGD